MQSRNVGDLPDYRSQSYYSMLRLLSKSTRTTTGCLSSLFAALRVLQHALTLTIGSGAQIHRRTNAWMPVVHLRHSTDVRAFVGRIVRPTSLS